MSTLVSSDSPPGARRSALARRDTRGDRGSLRPQGRGRGRRLDRIASTRLPQPIGAPYLRDAAHRRRGQATGRSHRPLGRHSRHHGAPLALPSRPRPGDSSDLRRLARVRHTRTRRSVLATPTRPNTRPSRELCRQSIETLHDHGRTRPDLDIHYEAERIHALIDGIAMHATLDPKTITPTRQIEMLSRHLDTLT